MWAEIQIDSNIGEIVDMRNESLFKNEDITIAREAVINGIADGKSKEYLVEVISGGLNWTEESATKFVNDIKREIRRTISIRILVPAIFWLIGGIVVGVGIILPKNWTVV